MKILLDTTVLKTVKTAAAPYVPGCRSSHLTEALAAGFGHKTNASLLAALRADSAVEAHVFDGPAYARLATLGAPQPTVPDFLTRAVATVSCPRPQEAPKKSQDRLRLRMRAVEMVLTRDGLHDLDGNPGELRHENDFAWFVSATLTETERVIARVFEGRQRTRGGQTIGYALSRECDGIHPTTHPHPMATRWAKLARFYVHAERFGTLRRHDLAKELVATAFAAYAVAHALGTSDVLGSVDFRALRVLVEGGWRAAFVTEGQWRAYDTRWDEPEDFVQDPRDQSRMPLVPWVGLIHQDIEETVSPQMAAQMFRDRRQTAATLIIDGDGVHTVEILGLRMRVETA